MSTIPYVDQLGYDLHPLAAFILSLVGLTLVGAVAEVFFPLKSYSSTDWLYKYRPRGKGSSFSAFSLFQLLAFASAGAFLGAATGYPIAGAATGLTIRSIGLLRRNNLPSLLKAGRLTAINSSLWAIPDSELIANALASTWPTWKHWAPSSNVYVLVLRRLYRRSYIVLLMVSTTLIGIGLVGALGWIAQLGYIITWSFLSSSIVRLSSFAEFQVCDAPRYYALAIHSIIGFVALWIMGATSSWVGLCAIISIVCTGLSRSQPKRVTHFSTIETGVIGPVSPEIVGYYLRGLGPMIAASIVIVFINLSIA
ncbi:hypothetical protein ACXZ66_08780 [Corynebacterium sp. S7]